MKGWRLNSLVSNINVVTYKKWRARSVPSVIRLANFSETGWGKIFAEHLSHPKTHQSTELRIWVITKSTSAGNENTRSRERQVTKTKRTAHTLIPCTGPYMFPPPCESPCTSVSAGSQSHHSHWVADFSQSRIESIKPQHEWHSSHHL